MKNKVLNQIKEGPKTFNELKENLEIRSGHFLNGLIKELREDNKIYYRKHNETYYLKDEEVVFGKFKETKRDFAFVDLDSGMSVFIPERFSNGALNGDLVRLSLFSLREGEDPDRRAGKVSKIIERQKGNIVGRYRIVEDQLKFIPDDYNSNKEFVLEDHENINENEILVTKFKTYKNNIVYLSVVENLGSENNAKIDYLVIAKRNNLPLSFPTSVLSEANSISHEITSNGREDLSDELVVTIDGEQSKDLDDAITVSKKTNGNFELKVHIADVAHYVKANSKIDDEAYERGTSTYLIDNVIPMLPEILSNNLASLNPDTRKYTLTAIMEIDKDAEVINVDLKETIVKSKYKLTYEEVDEYFKGGTPQIRDDRDVTVMINDAKELSKIIRIKKIKEGMIDFVLPETKFTLDANGNPTKLIEKYQTESEKLIEDLMVITNQSVANFLEQKKLPGMYRINGKPTENKLTQFFEITKIFGEFSTKPIDKITSKDLAHFVTEIEDKPYGDILKKFMIQSMEKAIYSPEDKGHYALGIKNYLHFTSPIRRYPDLIVHRIIKNYYIKGVEYSDGEKDEYLEHSSKWLSDKERAAMMAERKLSDIKKARYMDGHIGEEVEVTITSVTSFGFFVDLKKQIQGLVRLESLTGDEFYYDAPKFSIIGKESKTTYKLGEQIKVRITGYDFVRGVVDLVLN